MLCRDKKKADDKEKARRGVGCGPRIRKRAQPDVKTAPKWPLHPCMLTSPKPSRVQSGTSIVAACGIYMRDILDAVPIDKYFEVRGGVTDPDGGLQHWKMVCADNNGSTSMHSVHSRRQQGRPCDAAQQP